MAASMRAVEMTTIGGPEVMRIVEVATPSPGPGEVVVRVAAAGLNYSDVLVREGRYVHQPPLPYRMGREFCGVVTEVGDGVSEVAAGDRVAGLVEGGAFAELVTARTDELFVCPEALPSESAASLLVQGLTALLIVRDTAHVFPEDTVLIHAAAGGLGLIAVQLCRMAGARVIGTASTEVKRDAIRALGAEAVDYSEGATPDWVEQVLGLTDGRGVTVLLECIGGDTFVRSFRDALAPLGRMVVYGMAAGSVGRVRNTEVFVPNKSLLGFYLGYHLTGRQERVRDAIAELMQLAMTGALRITVDRCFPLDDAPAAYQYLRERRNIGKVLIKP